MTQDSVLHINQATRSFSDRPALNGLDLAIGPGEVVALLGPNGAGKTTLMRAISGRLKLDSGRILVAGGEPALSSEVRRCLGIVPQTIALYPNLTGRQNLDVFARLSGVSGQSAKDAVELGLQRAQLSDRADDSLNELSGGMQRRLNIVAGTLHDPQLLLLDEPTVGVDLDARQAIHALLDELCQTGMAIVVSTHDFEQAAEIADRVAFMAEGSLLADGSVAELVGQAFGDSKEGVVALATGVSDTAAQVLRDGGFRPTSDERFWSGPVAGGYEDLLVLESRLEDIGDHVAEIRLRDPGLNGVFMHLMESRS